MLRMIAWEHAIKYAHDPVLSRTHEKYLEEINKIVDKNEELKKKFEVEI